MGIESIFGGGGLGGIGKLLGGGGGLGGIGQIFSGGGLGKIGEMLQGFMGMLQSTLGMSGAEQSQANDAVNQAQSNAAQSGANVQEIFQQLMQMLGDMGGGR